jgi:hypothetical protein
MEVSAPERTRYVIVHMGTAELRGSRPMRYPTSGIWAPATNQAGTMTAGALMDSEAQCGLRGRHTVRATATPEQPAPGASVTR